MSGNSCSVRAGRLVEIRVDAYRSVPDVEEMMESIRRAVLSLARGSQAVIAADWRPVRVFSPDVAEIATKMLTTFNPRVERSAILLGGGHPTTLLQVARLVREAHHPSRQLFESPTAMKTWLKEILRHDEAARLDEFIAS